MDKHDWHQQAHQGTGSVPPAVTAADLAALSDSDRLTHARQVRAALHGIQVASPRHEALRADLQDQIEFALSGPIGIRTLLAVSAPNTIGKTTLIKDWAQGLYRDWTKSSAVADGLPEHRPAPGVAADHVPVCWVSLLSATRSKGLYIGLLEFLGYSTNHRSEAALATLMPQALRYLGVRLVILDDAHMLQTGNTLGRQVVDAVKHLATEVGEAGGVLMLVGAGLADRDVLLDPQIAGRLWLRELAPYEVDTTAGKTEWQHLLRTCEATYLPYMPHNSAGVFANDNAAYLWRRTQGYVGDLTDLLTSAVSAALASGGPLTRELLAGCAVSYRAHRATSVTPWPATARAAKKVRN